MKNLILLSIVPAAALLSGCATYQEESPPVTAASLPSPLSLAEIREMSAKGVSEATILAALRASRAVYQLSAQDIAATIAVQADALAKAKNLANARSAFKVLSESLVAHFKANGAPPGTYFEVYCPIAKASWLQAGQTLRNPYLGPRSATPTWGWACSAVVKGKIERPPSRKG